MNSQYDGLIDQGDGYYYDPSDGSTWDDVNQEWINLPESTAAVPPDVIQQVETAAAEGWSVGTVSDGLLKLGATAAQLAMLYQNVKSSQQLTPQALQYLQKERAALQQNTQSSNTMWMWAAIGVGVFLVMAQQRRD